MADFKDHATTLKGKHVTVSLIGIGNADEFAGTLAEVGDDYVELDAGIDQPRAVIPFAAIACITYR